MNYEQKYLKYKAKYLALKAELEGGEDEKTNEDKKKADNMKSYSSSSSKTTPKPIPTLNPKRKSDPYKDAEIAQYNYQIKRLQNKLKYYKKDLKDYQETLKDAQESLTYMKDEQYNNNTRKEIIETNEEIKKTQAIIIQINNDIKEYTKAKYLALKTE
jgi:chromosome segregation ATPase